MIPIWLALLLSWALWAIILAICSQFHLGVSFDIRWYNKLEYFFRRRKFQKKK